MRRLPLWAILPVLMVLAACSGQTSTLVATPTPVAATAEPSSIASSPTNIIPTLPPRGTSGTTTATATPTPASLLGTSTPIPSNELAAAALTPTTTPATTLAITIAPIVADVRSTAGPNGIIGSTRMETAKTPDRRPSSQKAWLRSPLSPKENAGSQRAGGTVHSLASTSRRRET